MSGPRILLIGGGGHARACIDVIEEAAAGEIVGLVGLPDQTGQLVMGYPVLGADADVIQLFARCDRALVTVGQIKSPETRMRLFSHIEAAHKMMPPLISPHAHVSRHATVGAGSIVMHGAVVNAGARIGRNCIINSQALVEHDAVVEDHCHVSTNAAVNSGVVIGMGAFIGSTTVIRQGVTIGAYSVIGMGQCVLVSCAPRTQLPSPRIIA